MRHNAPGSNNIGGFRGAGLKLTDPVRRLWAGERNAEALTAGLDNQESTLLRCVLALVRS